MCVCARARVCVCVGGREIAAHAQACALKHRPISAVSDNTRIFFLPLIVSCCNCRAVAIRTEAYGEFNAKVGGRVFVHPVVAPTQAQVQMQTQAMRAQLRMHARTHTHTHTHTHTRTHTHTHCCLFRVVFRQRPPSGHCASKSIATPPLPLFLLPPP